eukprot:COSAG02_NODE_4_length_69935_cov_46.806590_35_plen_187_part_00
MVQPSLSTDLETNVEGVDREGGWLKGYQLPFALGQASTKWASSRLAVAGSAFRCAQHCFTSPMEPSAHAAVSAEAAAFRAKMREAGRALTGPGVDHAMVYESAAPAPAPESPHKMRAAGSDRFSINGGAEGGTPKQKKHYDTASHMRSDHVDAAFKVRLLSGATPAAAVGSALQHVVLLRNMMSCG